MTPSPDPGRALADDVIRVLHDAGTPSSLIAKVEKVLSRTPAIAAAGEVREALAEILKRKGFTSRDGTALHGGTYDIIDAILAALALPQSKEAGKSANG